MKELECVNCGGQTEIDREHNRIVCPYCDSVFVLDPQQDDGNKTAEDTVPAKNNSCCGCIFLLLVTAFIAYIFLRLFSLFL